MKNNLICIVGATASGKTALAIELAQKFSCEIVSADARQFYREIPIGSAFPSNEELALVPHHFIGSHSIHSDYNVGKYVEECLSLLNELFKKNPIQILVGGSGLYIKGVLEGFDELPEHDETLRNELIKRYKNEGIGYLQERLKIIDPEFYEQIDQQNPQRLMRAIEISAVTGKSNLELRKKGKQQRSFSAIKIGIDLPREILYNRINERVDRMVANGLIEEAKSLFPFKEKNALQTVGYKELFDYFEGKYSLEDAIEKIKQHTRNFAKRQITWFKRDENIQWNVKELEIN